MKILTEREQKCQKIVELTKLKNKVMSEAEAIKKIRDKELYKEKRFWFPKTANWGLIHILDERMIAFYKAAETLIEYRDLIENSIHEKTTL